MTDPPTHRAGLQIERTQLAWERTAIGFLTIAGILMFHADSPLARDRIVLAFLAICLALTTFAIARERGRSRVIGDRDRRRVVRSLRTEIAVTGWATTALAALILLGIVLGM